MPYSTPLNPSEKNTSVDETVDLLIKDTINALIEDTVDFILQEFYEIEGKRIVFWRDEIRTTIREDYKEFLGSKYGYNLFIEDKAMVLEPSGRTHNRNGWNLYQGTEDKNIRMYAWDGEKMYVCGPPYKDEEGTWDGEPEYPLLPSLYKITTHD